MSKVIYKKGLIKDCCKKSKNLEEQWLRDDLSAQVCKVCGCRHFRAVAKLGNLIR